MILIVAAMEEEVAAIRACLSDTKEERYAAISFVHGQLKGREVLLMKSGVGKVAAALTTTVAMEHYPICLLYTSWRCGRRSCRGEPR